MRLPWFRTRKTPPFVRGVWEVVHTTKGDIDMGPPVSVRIDGGKTTYEFAIHADDLDVETTGATLHRGKLAVDVELDGRHIIKDGSFMVIQDEWLGDYVGKGSYLKPSVCVTS